MPRHIATLDGEELELRFSFEALCLMQEQHGVNVFDESAYNASPRTVSVLLWGALRHLEKEAPSIEAVRKGLDMSNYKPATKAVYAALEECLPKKDATDGKPSGSAS